MAGVFARAISAYLSPEHPTPRTPPLSRPARGRCGKFAEAAIRATNELETVVTIIYANQRQMRRHDPLRKYMDVIADQAEKESPIKPSELAQRTVDIDSLRAEDLEYNYDKVCWGGEGEGEGRAL